MLRLAWDGCFNVRDLGGLETASGGRTRRGAVVRADNVRRLTAAGWQAALDHGVRRLVDLRFEGEEPGEPGPPDGVEVVVVSLLRPEHDPEVERAFDERMRDADDIASVFASGYIRTLLESPGRVAAAVAAVADADASREASSSTASRARTARASSRRSLLGVAGVPDEIVAADYAESDANMTSLFGDWIATAASEAELELRRRLIRCSRTRRWSTVLAWLRGTRAAHARTSARRGSPTTQIDEVARAPGRTCPDPPTGPLREPRTSGGRRVREALELVPERLEDAVAAGVLERAGEQPVGQRGVARQQRAVQIGADRRVRRGSPRSPRRRRSRALRGRARGRSRRGRAASGPAWFSNPATVVGIPSSSTSSSTSPISRFSPATVSSGKSPRPAATSRRGRGSRARAAGSRRRPREARSPSRPPIGERRLAARGRARRAPARDPGHRRRRRGRMPPARAGHPARQPSPRERGRAESRPAGEARRCCRGRRRC